MNTQTAAESSRRRHARTPVGATFDIRLSGEGAGVCRAVIADFSRGGMTFETDAVLEQGMTLHLRLPSALEIRGEVRSVGAAAADGRRRYGVKFHKIGYICAN